MVFTPESLPTRKEINPIANEIIGELPDDKSVDETENEEENESAKEEKIKEIIGLQNTIDSSIPYIYKTVELSVLDQVFTLESDQLITLRYTLGANDRSSTINVALVDPELKIADIFFTHSRAKGGIKLPPEFGAQSTTSPTSASAADSGSNTGSINLDEIPNGLKGDELAKTIVQYCKDTAKGNITSTFQIAAILGTCEIESSMGEFLSEIGGESSSYAPWYGRGLVQITHKENYQKAGKEMGLGENFFTDNPEAMTELKYAIPALILGMKNGWYTSTKLDDCTTFDQTRNIVNPGESGTRRQNYISYCEAWQGRLDGGEFDYSRAQYALPPNDGSQSRQIPNVYPPEENATSRQFIDNRYPKRSNRPQQPGQDPSLSPNLPGNTRNQFPLFPPGTGNSDDSGGYPVIPSTNDQRFPGYPDFGDPNNTEDPIDPQTGQATDPLAKPEPKSILDEEITPDQTEETSDQTEEIGNKITLKLVTVDDKSYTLSFILTDDSVSDLPLPTFSFNGTSIRYKLDLEKKTENFEEITPQEYFRILAASYSLPLIDKTIPTKREKIDLIDQKQKTDHQVAMQIAKDSDISVVDDLINESIELQDLNEPKTPTKVIVTDIISIQFSDQGVTTEEPLYPVSIELFTTSELLELKPEDSISLDNVYSFIPDSLKKDTWLINTISHDVLGETTSIDLTKYIPKPIASGAAGVGAGQLSESQILEKYKSAVVKVGSASGCFISTDGYILTAAHMSGSTNIEDIEGNKYQAQEIDIVESNDIMLMKVEANGVPIAPIAPDTSIYKTGSKLPIIKIGHGITSEDGAGEGGNTPKYWDATTSFVREIAESYRGLSGGIIVADDKEIDFVNPGDSGCPWFDSYGLIVGCTSGGDRSHEEGAGKKDSAWSGTVENIIKMLDKNGVKYEKGQRIDTVTGSTDGTGTNTGGDGLVPGWTNPSPNGVMTSGFGLRNAPTTGASSDHKGVDLAAGQKTDVLAATNGTVIDSDNDTNGSGYGIYVVIKNSENVAALYGHLESKSVSTGDTVTMGQVIGKEDNTGTSTGSHLHFGIAEGVTGNNIWSSGTFVDPLNYISVKSYNRYAIDSLDSRNFQKCVVDLDSKNRSRFRNLAS